MENLYIGIDLGTSSIKLLLVNSLGEIINTISKSYDVSYPKPKYTEQDPKDWVKAMKEALSELLLSVDKSLVKGISFGGQMHGLVVLDKNDNVIRPCILWNDGRTEKETEYLNTVIGKDKLSSLTGNIAFAGFTAPKLLWLKENEKDNFSKIEKIMLPKDYLSYILSGEYYSEVSDASGTLLFDVKNRCWSKEMCDICSIDINKLPKVVESYTVVGNIKEEIAKEFGLLKDVKIVIGGGDNAAAAIGTGTITEGACNISLGTSGTLFVSSDKFSVDSKNAIHSFAHANGKYHLMGCILTAASARSWWLEDILKTNDYVLDEKEMETANTDNLYFLPYLNGERSPHNDTNAKGAFIGLNANTKKADMSLSILEGVSFAIRDCLEVAKSNGVNISYSTMCGGGAKSKIWCQMMADVLNIEIKIPKTEQGPSFGAAILSMVGAKEYSSVEEACSKLIKITKTYFPNKDKVEYYQKKYETYIKLYPKLKDIF